MIIVRVSSGLGNLMYQYALLCSLKKIYKDVEIKIDINDYKRNKLHTGYILDKIFEIKEEIANEEECSEAYSKCRYYDGFGKDGLSFQSFRNLYRKIYCKLGAVRNKRNESHMIYDYKFNIFNPEVFNLDKHKNWYLSGYWQNLRYFDWNKEELKQVFDFSPNLNSEEMNILAKIQSCNSVSVHVRKGDYTGSGFDLCGDEYYYRAIQLMKDKIGECTFFFFSDDANYVKEHFGRIDSAIIVSNDVDNLEMDMFMMGKCNHHIIPNSSFSFWPAYLMENEQSITVCPQYTLSDGGKMYQADYPQNWIRIENRKGLCDIDE